MGISTKIRGFIVKLQNLSEAKKIIIIFVVVAISALIMGFFWIKSTENNISRMGESLKSINLPKIDIPNIQTNTPNVNQANVTPTPTPKNQTADWKTYTNTQYGFEIKYPSNYQYLTNNYGVYTVSFYEIGGLINFDLVIDSSRNYTESIQEFLNQLDQSWIKSKVSPSIDRRNITVSENSAIEYQQPIGGSFAGNYIATIFKKDNAIWSFNVTPIHSSDKGITESDINLYHQILSTFKFTK